MTRASPTRTARRRRARTGSAPSVSASSGLPADLRAAIESFERRSDETVGGFAARLDAAPTPGMIYHYTNDAGLRGIIEGGRLWFTDIFNLNDPSELRYGIGPVTKIMQAEATKGPGELKQFSDNLIEMLNGGIERIAHYFVCCFSTAGDDLGQWRAYADNGRGYALGFDGKMLEEAFAKPGGTPVPNNATFPLTYGDKPLRQIQNQIVQDVIPLVSLPRGRDLVADQSIDL